MGGVKHDGGKTRLDLIPSEPLRAAGDVFAFGAEKYGERNWESGIAFGRLYGALQRHLTAFWDGNDIDDESGLHHLGHAMCCLLMLSHEALNPQRYESWDDRAHRTVTYERAPGKPPVKVTVGRRAADPKGMGGLVSELPPLPDEKYVGETVIPRRLQDGKIATDISDARIFQ